jgi:hypothetical protein
MKMIYSVLLKDLGKNIIKKLLKAYHIYLLLYLIKILKINNGSNKICKIALKTF